jgi:hypothetical protein
MILKEDPRAAKHRDSELSIRSIVDSAVVGRAIRMRWFECTRRPSYALKSRGESGHSRKVKKDWLVFTMVNIVSFFPVDWVIELFNHFYGVCV